MPKKKSKISSKKYFHAPRKGTMWNLGGKTYKCVHILDDEVTFRLVEKENEQQSIFY